MRRTVILQVGDEVTPLQPRENGRDFGEAIDVPAGDELTRALDDLTTFILGAAKTGAVSDAYRDAADRVRAAAGLDDA